MGPVTRHGRRGFSIPELLVAASLTLVFAGLVGQAMAATSRTALSGASRAVAQAKARAALDELELAVTSARPLGTCLYPIGASLNSCQRVGENAFTLETATANKMVLYAYTNSNAGTAHADGTSGGEILTAPDKVTIEVTNDNVLLVTRYAPQSAATYTNPSWNTDTPVKQLAAGSVDDLEPFRYFDASGAKTTDPAKVALVEVHATVSYRDGRTTGTFTLTTTLSLSGAVYGSGT